MEIRKRKFQTLTLILVSIVTVSLLALFIGSNLYLGNSNSKEKYSPYIPDFDGYTRVNVEAQAINNYGIVQLTGNCFRIIAYTEPWQARSIENGLRGKVDVRPNCHDITKEILDLFGIKVIALKINEVRNNTYIGELILQQGNKVLSLDVRPSDGTAIALRENAPIYIKNELLEKYGKRIC